MAATRPPLRSTEWFGTADKSGFMYRGWMKNQGIPDHEFQRKPIIGTCNTRSELTPCNAHFRGLAERVRRGVFEAGGYPVEFPVFSNGESNLPPTAMFTRNLASMDVEEAIRGNPIDAVVLMEGCDKTTPALLMGAASCDVPALGVTLPHNPAIPAVHARRYVLAHRLGMRIVQMALEGLTLSKILTRAAFENAIRVHAAIGGSTNAVIHLKAIAGRIGVPLELEDWTRLGKGTPTRVGLTPSGRFLMEEFHHAGGLPAVLRRLGEAGLLPHPGALTANGLSLRDNVKHAPMLNDEVIRPLSQPLVADGGICVLRGNLAPCHRLPQAVCRACAAGR